MSARMKLLTQSLRSGGGKAIYHDVPPEDVFHKQQRADNADDNKGTSCSSSLCLVFGLGCLVFQEVLFQGASVRECVRRLRERILECCCPMAFKPEK